MFLRTRPLRFYKSHNDRSHFSPVRRWVWHKIFAAILTTAFGGTYISYKKAGMGSEHDGKLCGPTCYQIAEAINWNAISTWVGAFAACEYYGEPFHQKLMEWYIWWYGVNMKEALEESITSYPTLEKFFVRELKPDVRPIDQTASLVSPVDGVVLSAGTCDVTSSAFKILHVKGAAYTLQNLLRSNLPPLKENMERRFLTLHMRAQDYHHVHAPCSFEANETVLVPGSLLPTTLAGFRWIPNIFAVNERICIRATMKPDAIVSQCKKLKKSSVTLEPSAASYAPAKEAKDEAARLSKSNKEAPSIRPAETPFANDNLWITLVGGTLVGKIDLKFDRRVHTNLPCPPEYAVHLPYKVQEKMLLRGEDIARFRWGSAVVLVVDVEKGQEWKVKAGDEVKVGVPLL